MRFARPAVLAAVGDPPARASLPRASAPPARDAAQVRVTPWFLSPSSGHGAGPRTDAENSAGSPRAESRKEMSVRTATPQILAANPTTTMAQTVDAVGPVGVEKPLPVGGRGMAAALAPTPFSGCGGNGSIDATPAFPAASPPRPGGASATGDEATFAAGNPPPPSGGRGGPVSSLFTTPVTSRGDPLAPVASKPPIKGCGTLKWRVFSLGVWCSLGIVCGGSAVLLGGPGAFASSIDNFRERAVEGADERWGEDTLGQSSSGSEEIDASLNKDAPSLSKEDQFDELAAQDFKLDKELKDLHTWSLSLRGSNPKDGNAENIIMKVKGFAKSYLATMKGIQKFFHQDDVPGALEAIATAAGDLHSLDAARRESSDLVRRKSFDDFDTNPEVDPAALADEHDGEVELVLKPQKVVYDKIVDHVEGFVQVLDGVDMSLLAPSHRHRDSDDGSSAPGIPHSQAQPLDFGSPRTQHVHQTSGPSGAAPNPHRSHLYPSGIRPLRREKNFKLFRNDPAVAAKHAHRVQSLGDDMCPRCELDDLECNCGKLFDCVLQMSEYDLIHVITDGYVDENPSSGTFGNFTVHASKLDLFGADEGVKEKLTRIKLRVTSGHRDINTCREVLQEFFMACNPSTELCSRSNEQSFQANIDDVCSAVDSPKKILFEAIGEEFDSFVDPNAVIPCRPLSFETCAQFIVEFDRLYKDLPARYLPNPARKDPGITLHDEDNLEDIFGNVNFITGYVFSQDSSNGVVSRLFSDSMKNDEPRPIALINPATGKVLGLSPSASPSLCGPRLEAQAPDSSNQGQLFHVEADGRIKSAKEGCRREMITVAEISDGVFRCNEGARLVLSRRNDDELLRQTWRMYSDGHIVSLACPNLAISYVEHDSLAVASQPESDVDHSVHVTITNPSTMRSLSVSINEEVGLRLYGGAGKTANLWGTNYDFKFDRRHWEAIFGSVDRHLWQIFGQVGATERVVICRNGEEHWSGTVSVFGVCVDNSDDREWQKYSTFANGESCDDDEWNWVWGRGIISGSISYTWQSGDRLADRDAACSIVTNAATSGTESQLFYIKKAMVEEEVSDDVFEIYSKARPNYYIGLGNIDEDDCTEDSMDVYVYDSERSILPYASTWKIRNDGEIVSTVCSDYALEISGSSIQAAESEGNANQIWTLATNETLLMDRSGDFVEWRHTLEGPAYSVQPTPGFPGEVDENSCLKSREEPELARSAMHACDESMAYLVGSSTSVGTLREIATLVDSNIENMPGKCCMDDATNSQFFGYGFDPSRMECENKGLFHLGISAESCNNAGGHWTRSPCITLKECIDTRPPHLDIASPIYNYQDGYEGLNTGFVRSSYGDDFPFDRSDQGCADFCGSLESSEKQLGMMITTPDVVRNIQKVRIRFTEANALSIIRVQVFDLLGNVLSFGAQESLSWSEFGTNLLEVDIGYLIHVTRVVILGDHAMSRSVVSLIEGDDLVAAYQIGVLGFNDQEIDVPASSFIAPIRNVEEVRIHLAGDIWQTVGAVEVFDTSGQTVTGEIVDDSENGLQNDGLQFVLDDSVDVLRVNVKATDCGVLPPALHDPYRNPPGCPGVFPSTGDDQADKAAAKLSCTTEEDNWYSQCCQWVRNSCVTNEPFDCTQLPQPVNLGHGFEPGCRGARTAEGTWLQNLCLGAPSTNIPLVWHGACCEWRDGECFPKNTDSEEENRSYLSDSMVSLRDSNNLVVAAHQLGVISSDVPSVDIPASLFVAPVRHVERVHIELIGDERTVREVEVFDATGQTVPGEIVHNSEVGLQNDGLQFVLDDSVDVFRVNVKATDCAVLPPALHHPDQNPPGCPGVFSSTGDDEADKRAARLSCTTNEDNVWYPQCCQWVQNSCVTKEPFDCTQLPQPVNLGHGFKPGCAGARRADDGTFSQQLCQGSPNWANPLLWHAACCEWTGTECVPKPTDSEENMPYLSHLRHLSNSVVSLMDKHGVIGTYHLGPTGDEHVEIEIPASSFQSETVSDPSACVCLYDNVNVPAVDSLPDYSVRSPPSFFLINSNDGTALGLRPRSDCSHAELEIEVQVLDRSPQQEFQVTRDGRITSVHCSERVLTASVQETDCAKGAVLHASKASYNEALISRQQWKILTNGRISNVACPELEISSLKEKDASLESSHFALVNPNTEMAMGIDGTNCEEGALLQLQHAVPGAPNQQFTQESQSGGVRLSSILCPNRFITVDDCEPSPRLYLSSQSGASDKAVWNMDGELFVESIGCPGKVIYIGDRLQHEEQLARAGMKVLLETNPQDTPDSQPINAPDVPNGQSQGIPQFEPIDPPRVPATTILPYDAPQPPPPVPYVLPHAGDPIILVDRELSSESKAGWNQVRRTFRQLMGPFFFRNPGNDIGLGIRADATCAHNMPLSVIDGDDHDNLLMFLGKHGSIFSKVCPGMVLSIDGDCDHGTMVKFEPFLVNELKMKWKTTNDKIESLNCPGKVIGVNENGDVVLQTQTANDPNQQFSRHNIRLLATNVMTDWNKNWTVAFSEPGYDRSSVATADNRGKILYPPNPAYSFSFDEFAREFSISDSGDERQCQTAREALGFDKDHPFDVEICAEFKDQMCENHLFAGVDLLPTGEDNEVPTLEFVPSEYEEAEYEDLVGFDQSAGYAPWRDPFQFEEQDYEDDPEFTEEPLPELEKVITLPNVTTQYDPGPASNLVPLQLKVLDTQHWLTSAEQLHYFVTQFQSAVCEAAGPDTLSIGVGCLPNIAKGICKVAVPFAVKSSYFMLLAATTTHHVFYRQFEVKTLGPDGDKYNFDMTKATYQNLITSINFNRDGMKSITANMKHQHFEMRSHLQTRHKQIRNQIGQDVADARNDIKGVIVDAQRSTAEGQRGMYDNMQSLSEQITESENRMKADIIRAVNHNGNFIQTAGNTILQFICETVGGECTNMIGPLEEGQSVIPVQHNWPEEEQNIFEQVHEIKLGMKSLQAIRLIGMTDSNGVDNHEQTNDDQGDVDDKFKQVLAQNMKLKVEVDDKFKQVLAQIMKFKDEVDDKFKQVLSQHMKLKDEVMAQSKMLVEDLAQEVLAQNKVLVEGMAEKLINSVGQADKQMQK